jgi:kynurenine 3-monooxygenase
VKFTVIGGGPVGCLISILLARRGHEVEVYERRADPRSNPPEAGRSINLALAARGMRALSEAGVLDALRPHMVPMPGRQLHLSDGSEAFSPYGQFEGEVNQSISRAELTRQLVIAAGRQPGIRLNFRQRCLGMTSAGALGMHDEDAGRTWQLVAERVIGADGAGSALRKALAAAGHVEASNELLDHDYKELTIPPVDGRSALGVREALHIWPRHNFMLIALPNADHSFTATLFMPRTGAVSFEALAAPGAARSFFEREFPDALALMPEFEAEFAAHPQGVLGTVRCSPWNLGERLVLLGDAAHAIVPFHGQGLNCGLEDCRILDALLADGEPEPFRRFSQVRRPDADAIAEMSLDNYAEMRDAVADPRHQVQRRLELMLERRHPGRFIPRYAMVMFHDRIPYSTALSRGRVQQQLLDRLVPAGTRDAAFLDGLDWRQADALVREQLEPIAG